MEHVLASNVQPALYNYIINPSIIANRQGIVVKNDTLNVTMADDVLAVL